MEKSKSNKCIRCGKAIKGSKSNDSSDDNLAHDNLIRNTTTAAMPCTADNQLRALEAWRKIKTKKKVKKYCAKCSIITRIGSIFGN